MTPDGRTTPASFALAGIAAGDSGVVDELAVRDQLALVWPQKLQPRNPRSCSRLEQAAVPA